MTRDFRFMIEDLGLILKSEVILNLKSKITNQKSSSEVTLVTKYLIVRR